MNPKSILSLFDLGEMFLSEFEFSSASAPSKIPDCWVSSPFPPANISREEDSSLLFEFALAGYNDDEIEVKFENDKLVLTLNPKEEEEVKNYRQKGIRRSKASSKFFVPSSHFDVDSVKAHLDKGILTIHIPAKEQAKPKRIDIKVM